MKNLNRILFVSLGLLLLISVSINAQNADTKIGEIFSKASADQQYGPVLESVTIPTSTLEDLMAKSEKILMFKFVDNEIYILNDKREVIYPAGKSIDADAKLAVYSISVINELISTGDQPMIQVEQRNAVLSITSGIQTLEASAWCPPLCP